MSKSVALEYATQGVRVNAVLPGGIETPLLREVLSHNEELAKSMIAHHPIGRFGTTDELASLVAYLACDEAAFITGSVFAADGGFTAG